MIDYRIHVIAIVEYEGQVLIGKKKHDPNHVFSDAWHIPGGKLEADESEEEALAREIKEEAGIYIKVNRFLDEIIVAEASARARWYLCSPLTHDLRPGGDLVEVKYVPESEILKIWDKEEISSWPPLVIEYFRH